MLASVPDPFRLCSRLTLTFGRRQRNLPCADKDAKAQSNLQLDLEHG